ncbi:hypothetical protein VN12_19730 [Pirellula sp. SH-Sr6A]|uniref:hypothetical protein n=1 Tax=Pirellula sp. SH-Sr6A TaxID=1632865 RepID=UPI00078EADAF|nr:hypothetical protein [Pirellula sp. SH-Sr6A]AMV30871.1 hypothetical protein VN12_02060 [Pirellula sp. SH-Sr6A]AMV34366.1 hypothetical protein VN12_19730 [Pirellula sp. SH-Sr6A]
MFHRSMMFGIYAVVAAVVLGCPAPKPIVLKPIPAVEAAMIAKPMQSESIQEVKAVEPTIIVHSASFDCPACDRWVRVELPVWKTIGWKIPDPLKDAIAGKRYPWFELIDGDGLRFEVNTYLTKNSYEEARKKALGSK